MRILIILVSILTMGTSAMAYETVRQHDENGKYIGRYEFYRDANPPYYRYYNANGKYLGRTEVNPKQGTSRDYDANGKYLGRTEIFPRQGVLREYDANGKYLGSRRRY